MADGLYDRSYKIPYSLNVHKWDAPITLVNKEGLGIKRPIKMTTLGLGAGLGLILPLWVFFKTSLVHGGFLGITLTMIGWEAFVFALVYPQKNGLDGFKWVLPTIQYWLDYSNRQIVTRGDEDMTAVSEVLRIKTIHKDGMVEFTDGWYGYVYDIDGGASSMLFDREADSILYAFGRFCQRLSADTAVNISTQFAPLDVSEQVYNAKKIVSQQTSVDLKGLALRKERFMEKWVSGTFATITQWVLISAPSKRRLNDQCAWFERQVSQGMARKCSVLKCDEATNKIAGIYRP